MSNELLADLLRAVGEPTDTSQVTFLGRDPILPTPFRIGDLGAAAIAASALQAARLHEARTGARQEIRVAVDAAAAAMRSSRYLRLLSAETSPGKMRPVGFYPTRDGRWIFFQRLFPHHLRRQLDVLGCDAEEASIARAALAWDAEDLEEAVIEAGACAAAVRSAEEWSRHDQAEALVRLPVVSVTRVADSEPEPLPPNERPLGGVRVLDLTRVLAGPTCARTLAEHGAEVLRVGTRRLPDDEQMSRDTGHGKRSCELDLRTSDGVATLQALVKGADVFAQGYRPGALARLGFSPEEVVAARPGMIYISLSAFGTSGPWKDRRGFDSVVQAASGIAHELTDLAGRPACLPANPLDYTAGYLAAFGTMVALARRAREGGSYHVEASLAQTGRYLTSLGRLDAAEIAKRPPELDDERLAQLMLTRATPYGTLRYLAPVAQLALTPARWARPSSPIGHDLPEWEV